MSALYLPMANAEGWASFLPALLSLVTLALCYRAYLLVRSHGFYSEKGQTAKVPAMSTVWVYNKRETLLHTIFGAPHELFSHAIDSLIARIKILRHRLIITANPEDAHRFANDRRLHLTEAYLVLFTAVPDLPKWIGGIDPDQATQRRGRRAVIAIKEATSTDRMNTKLPQMIDEAMDALARLPRHAGDVNCHETLFPLVYRMVIRMFGLTEHTKDIATMDRVEKCTWDVAETSNSFLTTQLPFIPTPTSIRRLWAGVKMAVEITSLLKARQNTGLEYDDYVQDMLKRDLPLSHIRDFVLGSMVGGVANPGALTTYALIFVGSEPSYQKRLRDQVTSAFQLDVSEIMASEGPSGLRRILKDVPLEAWDEKLPFLDACIKEIARMIICDVLVRRFRPDAEDSMAPLTLSGHPVKQDEFAAIWLSSLHYDPRLYADPERFDPDRFARGEGASEDHFGAWGIGRHPCPGIRFARVAVKVAIATFLLACDYETIDPRSGARYTLTNAPKPAPNDEHRRFPATPVALRYTDNKCAV